MKRQQTKIVLIVFIGLAVLVLLLVRLWLGDIPFFVSWKTYNEGTFNGMPYVLQSRQIRGFSTGSNEERFRLGKLPIINIDAFTTDWGPPYSNDIFGTTPHCYTAQDIPLYRSEEKNAADYEPFEHNYTMLYLSPEEFSKDDYDRYCAFMKSEWPRIDKKYTSTEYDNFPHIIGLVYARQDDITKTYKGRFKPYPTTEPANVHRAILRIQNDGRVEMSDEDESNGIRYSGLSNRVQMPGKRLVLDTNPANGGMGSLAVLRTFKDNRGRSPDMDFQVLEKKP